MGTYRQPSQLIDKRFAAFGAGMEKIDTLQQKQADYQAKLDYEKAQHRAKQLAADQKKLIAQQKVDQKHAQSSQEIINKSQGTLNAIKSTQDYLVEIYPTADGNDEVVQRSYQDIEALIKRARPGDDPATTAVETDYINYPTDQWTDQDKQLFASYVKESGVDSKVEYVNLLEWYDHQIKSGNDAPFGVGVLGSAKSQLTAYSQQLAALDPTSIEYTNTKSNIELGTTNTKEIIEIMNSTRENTKTIVNSDGRLTPLDQIGSVLWSDDDNFQLNVNAQLNWNENVNGGAFTLDLNNNAAVLKYKNLLLKGATELDIDLFSIKNQIMKKGKGLVGVTTQEPLDLLKKNIKNLAKDDFKAVIKKTQSITDNEATGKQINYSQIVEDWDRANQKLEEVIKTLVYDPSRVVKMGENGEIYGTGSFGGSTAQNNWQLLGGATKSGLGKTWKNTPEQQDYIVGVLTDQFKKEDDDIIKASSYITKDIKEEARSQSASNWVSGGIMLRNSQNQHGFSGGTKQGRYFEYGLQDVFTNFNNASANSKLLVARDVLNDILDDSDKGLYMTGAQVQKALLTADKDADVSDINLKKLYKRKGKDGAAFTPIGMETPEQLIKQIGEMKRINGETMQLILDDLYDTSMENNTESNMDLYKRLTINKMPTT